VISAMLVCPVPAAARDPRPPLDLTTGNLTKVLDPVMNAWLTRLNGPGAVIVVANRDGIIFAKGYGFSDVEAKTPFTADATLVRPGSISKLFTGIAVMQLVDAGKLDLDRDVNGYIDFTIPTPAEGVPVTLRRLLMHRAGFEEHAKDLFSASPEPVPLGRWLAMHLPRRLFPGGDVEAYSNYGLALAGYVVERVSGEPYAAYVQSHILDPLGMKHSTFLQPLPPDLAPLMAKGYRPRGRPPLDFFETISAAPAGALTATGTDMGRFMRALLNGGELDGVRILSKARLDEMMAPTEPTPAGYLGLAFFGTKVAGHDTVGHDGATMAFFSQLLLFPERGFGIFVSRNGLGEIKSASQYRRPVTIVAQRFLPAANATASGASDTPSHNARMAGVYQPSRRAESTFLRLNALLSESLVKFDDTGNAHLLLAIWPFGNGVPLKRLGPNLYEGTGRIAFVDDSATPYLTQPAIRLQRVPWPLDVRWIAPAMLTSALIILLTTIAWPIASARRWWRKRPWSSDARYRSNFIAARLGIVIDLVVILAAVVLFSVGTAYPTILNDRLDPLLVVLYALAWLGVAGAVPTLWAALLFWRDGVGSRWSRIHHTLIAAASIMCTWFFLTFRFAGTTLSY
jgi:CubicO group peptidase (beta-lactamase class C family)